MAQRWNLGGPIRRMIAAMLRCLPDPTLLQIHNDTGLVLRVDYANRDIFLNVRTAVEYHVRLRSCAKEPDTIDWIERYFMPGDVFYDIGANVGVYSLVAAHVLGDSGKVFAFEPGFANYAQLCANVALNQFSQTVTAFPIALASHTKLEHFRYTNLEAGAAGHTLTLPGIDADCRSGGHTQSVLGYRLDDFCEQFALPAPSHLKIDVDGAEYATVEGAARTIQLPSLRTVCVEVNERLSANQTIATQLRQCGFEQIRRFPRAESNVFNYYFIRNDLSMRQADSISDRLKS
jgi:FkbM family methyltransferase